jgi:DNA-binding response OmpR family regulator
VSRVLIVEDNPNTLLGLRKILELDGHEVAVAEDGHAGLEKARIHAPDLILLDMMLPRMTGEDVLRALREDGLHVPVMILTAKSEEIDKVHGFHLGADDYVTKPFGMMELTARVRALLRRSQRAATVHHAQRFGSVEVCAESRSVLRNGTPVLLAPRELDLLLALMRRRGAVISRVQLLAEVWGHRSAVLTRTVDYHVAELRRKLEDDPARPRHIITVRKAGYRFQGEVPPDADSR